MKFLHLADLHLGKRVNGFSMTDDQKDILDKILAAAADERPDAVLIAGDVYDRAVPPVEAVNLFDDFLVRLSRMGIHVYIISGNHDSEERVSFGGRLMEVSGVHFAPRYEGTIEPMELADGHGTVYLWPIPFLKPAHVRAWIDDSAAREAVKTYPEAMQYVIGGLEMAPGARHVALVHQFITGGTISDSEEHSVGGLDDIPAAVFAPFDYVALGHLHGPQWVGREAVRYAGSPLKYSLSEVEQKKSITVVELGAPGTAPVIREIPLVPLRDMVRIRGSFKGLMAAPRCEDYCALILTDENREINAMNRLRAKFPNAMTLAYENEMQKTGSTGKGGKTDRLAKKSPLELFGELFEDQNDGKKLSPEQTACLEKLIDELWGVNE